MLEMEDRRISKELHSDEQSADRRLSFTAAIYNCLRYQQYKVAASAPRLHVVVELWDKLSEKRKRINQVFKCIDLPSDLMYLAV